MATQEDFPRFTYSFHGEGGEEVGDRVFANDLQHCGQLEAVFPQLAPKKAVIWCRWEISYDCSGDIKR